MTPPSTVERVARAIYAVDHGGEWMKAHPYTRMCYTKMARAAKAELDAIAAMKKGAKKK